MVKLWTILCFLMLLACFTQPKPHDGFPLHSVEMRDPNIDALWYKDRGIRPVGRFGRRTSQRSEGSHFRKHRFCYPEVLAVDWLVRTDNFRLHEMICLCSVFRYISFQYLSNTDVFHFIVACIKVCIKVTKYQQIFCFSIKTKI